MKKNHLLLFLPIIAFSLEAQNISSDLINSLSDEDKSRLIEMYSQENMVIDQNNLDTEITNESLEKVSPSESISTKFGYDFFSTIPTSLSAVGDLPLPNDYKISIKDQFTVILSGSKNLIFDLTVKLDGTILFPEIGSISVAGETFGEVKQKLKNLINTSFIGVEIDLSIKNLMAKKISIVGAVNSPGTYLVNPFSTITSSLAYSGGISEIGSLRKIKLIRSNGEIFYFDLYDLLINGDRSNDITIDAGDTILIEPANQFVELKGAVKRPLIYEILPNETLEDIINFGLGFNNASNRSNISLTKFSDDYSSFSKDQTSDLYTNLKNVDQVEVFSFLADENDEILVQGAVYKAGFYSVNDFGTLSDLVNGIEFVDVYPWLAALEKFDEKNLKKEIILFSLKDEKTYESVELTPGSKVFFLDYKSLDYSSLEERTQDKINDYALNISISDSNILVPIIGNFSVSSILDFVGLSTEEIDPIVTFVQPIEDMVYQSDFTEMFFKVSKFNSLQLRTATNNLISITISGEIDYPGTYAMRSGSFLSDLYKVAGDFKENAFFDGIILQRDSVRESQIKVLNKNKKILQDFLISSKSTDAELNDLMINSLSEEVDTGDLGRVSGDFSPISATASEVLLYDGDTIFIPKKSSVVSVVGEVLNPVSFILESSLTVREAIELAGGLNSSAKKTDIYVIDARGAVRKISKNIFSGNSRLKPGDTVVVPRNYNSKGIAAIAPITEILSNLAFSAAALDNLKNN